MKWMSVVAAACLAGALILTACGGASPKSDGGDSMKHKREGLRNPDDTGPDDTGALSDPKSATKISGEETKPAKDEPKDGKRSEDDECVRACLDRNMARAVAAEIIRTDCETECADTQSPKE